MNEGTKLGRYEIRRKIGAGGMGEVYLAEDTGLERKVALKILPGDLADNAERMRRFVQEAKSASALNHPNIITIYEIGDADSTPFIATEYIDGETLRERLNRERPTIEEALDIAVQTVAALAAAHEAGIIHRDIKPENIMLRRDRLVKVLDFGLAKLTETNNSDIDAEAPTRAQVKTEPGMVLGTVAYMSPEQARGKETDARTDVWSLGVLIYEMIAGKTPFEGETNADRFAAIIHKEPAPLSRLAENIPPRLEEIVSKCMEKDRDERYQTVKDLLIDLRRLKKKLDFESEMERSHAPHDWEKTDDGQKASSPTQMISAAQSNAAQTMPTTSSAEYVVTEIKRHKKGFAFALGALLILSAAGAFLWYKFAGQNKPPEPAGKMRMTRLISGLSGRPGNVSISPDGKYVAYALWESGKASLWVKQVSQDTSLQILPPVENAWFTGTTFSNDGEIVYFVAGNRETNPLGSLYQVPVLGGKEPKKILDHVSTPISLSPDGKQFAFIRQFRETAEYVVLIANIDGSGEAKKIASRRGDSWYSEVAWSPDGKTIACAVATVTGGFSNTVVEIPVEGGEEKAVTDHKWRGEITRMKWIKDGSGLVLSGAEKPASSRQLWYLSYPDGKVTRITNDLNDYGSVGITSDAGTLVSSLGEWTNRIWTVAPNEDESRAKRISNGKEDGRNGLALLPDGRMIYVSRVNDDQNIWVMNADGTENKVFRSDTFPQTQPQVSPDGRYIVFQSGRPDNIPHIWRTDADGGNPKQLTDKEDYRPSFSPDGRWVVFSSFRTGKETLWKVPVDGGEAVQIFDKVAAIPIVSPDGKLISCNYYDESAKPPRIRPALISFEDGRLVKVLDFPATAQRPVWSPDGRDFLYIDARNDVGNIWSVPVAGGKPVQLTRFTSDFIDSFSVSRDGKRFFISRASGNNDVVLIKDFR